MLALTSEQILQWLLLAQCLLLSAYLLQRKDGTLWPLALLLLNMALQMIWDIGLQQDWFSWIGLRAVFAFAYGPLMLALVRHLAWRSRQVLTWPHALPSLFAPLLISVWLGSNRIMGLLVLLSFAIYLSRSLIELGRYQRTLKATRSQFEAQSLGWLWETLLGLALVGLIDLLRQLLGTQWPAADQALAVATYAAATALVYFLSWRGLQQSLRHAQLGPEDEAAVADPPTAQDCPSELADLLRQDAKQLLALMEQAQPFLDPELTVLSLAAQLDWQPKHLSLVINQQLQRNFNDLVNGYRVQAACRLLSDPGRRADKLLAIQMDAGFASKSVFNAAFKRHAGLTPSQFRAQSIAESG